MILFLILSFSFFLAYIGIYKKAGLLPLIGYFLPLLILILFLFECKFQNVALLNSDELGFVLRSQGYDPWHDQNRLLWYIINYVIVEYDNLLGEIGLKLINIPISATLLIVLWHIFEKDNKIFLLPIFLPYFSQLAVLNLRDTLIFFLTASAIATFSLQNLKAVLLSVTCVISLLFLRPMQAAILLFLFLSSILYFLVWTRRAIPKRSKSVLTILAFFAVIVIILPQLSARMSYLLTWSQYLFAEDQSFYIQRALMNSGYTTGNLSHDLPLFAVRYLFTPLASSVWKFLLEGHFYEWGMLEVFLRFVNQLNYYALGLYLFLNIPYLPGVLRSLNQKQSMVLLIFFSYFPIYALYLFGQGHLRTKVPFQIIVFILSLLIWRYKSKRISIGKP